VPRRPVLARGVPTALLLLAGCHQRAYMAMGPDGGGDGGSDALAPLTLDISVTGCASFDVTNVVCSGPAPLSVVFAPVGTPAFTSFLWTFGDGSPSSSERAPAHTYTLPGSYDVTVSAAGTVGTVSATRKKLIAALPLAAGAPCDVDAQCSGGLRCACQPGTGCGSAFTRGVCTTSCPTGFCGAAAVCATYALGTPADGGIGDAAATVEAGPFCLADCAGTGCPAGFVCQHLPAAGLPTASWVQACLPIGAAHDFGASCRGATGALEDGACTTGLCADVGDLGLCSAPCDDAHPCPPGGACARPAGTTAPICLPTCSAAAPCPADPSLACSAGAAADAGTDSGVPILAGAVDAAYCATR